MIFEHGDYRTVLKNALSEKAKERAGYSLRAFAEKIHISSSYLSEVLNHKKALSVELAFKIALKLNLTDLETQYFCLLVQIEQEQDPIFREEFRKRLNDLNPKMKSHDLSADLFKTIAEWHHIAIMELTYLPGFKKTAEYISRKLGILKTDADLAIDRLERLELIEDDEKGRSRKVHSYILTSSKIPNAAFTLCHRQVLEKAIESLDEQTPKERVTATDVLAFDSKYLPEVDRLSQEFSSAIMKLSEKSKVRDSVFALAVHFFNVTKKSGAKS